MLLSTLFSQLSYGEISQLAIGGKGSGTIPEDKYGALISHINIGLTKLHTRFPLKEEEVFIQQYEHITEYKLHSDYALSNDESTEAYKYIVDNPENPFKDDIIRIEQVYDEVGLEIDVNDSTSQHESIFISSYDTIQILYPVAENAVSVIYRANHALIPLTTTDIESVEIDIPPSLEEALMSFVASRCHSVRSNQEAVSESSFYYAKYSALCREIEQKNLLNNSQNITNTRLEQNGWK